MSRKKFIYKVYNNEGLNLLEADDIHKVGKYLNTLHNTDIYTYYKVYNYLNRPPKRMTGFKNISIEKVDAKKK